MSHKRNFVHLLQGFLSSAGLTACSALHLMLDMRAADVALKSDMHP
jgi:hypothetical protein